MQLSSSSFFFISLCFVSFPLLFHRLVGLVSLLIAGHGKRERTFSCGSLFSSVDRRSVAYLFVVVIFIFFSNESLVCCAVVVPLNE